ncbi:hypothetical protein, partial [Bradyrhizobium sp. Leo121]|uniref:hypothetical protein n=1 Tax=Bradyrhizobium sp. Leo121 TaxID=1571195 RepID=UPI0010F3DB44
MTRENALVMPGLDPGIHVLQPRALSWMAGSSPAMTENVCASGALKTLSARPSTPVADAAGAAGPGLDAGVAGLG